MNTKKITALALAALMAAGSTSTVFAAVDSSNKDKVLEFVDSTGKTYYEENDDGLLVVDKDGVAPGESVYFRLQDNASVSGIEDKDRDRIKVYADWKMGKDYIKDIEVIYDKGNFQSTTNQQVISYDYTLVASGSSLNGKTLTVNGSTKKPTNYKFATELDGSKALEEALLNDYTVTEGFVIGGTYYTNDAAGVKAYLNDKQWVEGDSSVTNATLAGTTYGTYTTGSGAVTLDENYMTKTGGTNYFVKTDAADMKGLREAIKTDLKDAGLDADWTEVTTDAPIYTLRSGIKNGKVESAAIVAKDVAITNLKNTVTGHNGSANPNHGPKDGFTYWVKIDTKESFTTKEQDIAGTLYLGTSKNSAEDKGSKLEIGLPLSNRIDDNNGSYVIKDGDTIYPDANGAVKFEDDAEEVTIYFGSNEDAWFTFNAAGQSALNLAYNTKFNKEIADLFPKANIDFISWIAEPAANRTGDLYITAEEDTFLYQVTEDGKGIKEVKGADYDENEGAWHIRTRKLGSYVISDMELDTTAKVEDKDEASSNSSTSSKPNGDKHNPDTGR